MQAPFVWDTSALVNWLDWYPADLMPQMWTLLNDHVEAGELIVPTAVVAELGSKRDSLSRWIKHVPKASIWEPQTADLALVARIHAEFPALAPRANRPSVADAYVVAAALALGGTVVSDERSKVLDSRATPPFPKTAKIDAACAFHGVACLSSRAFMRLALRDA
jgi:hypothetical protein